MSINEYTECRQILLGKEFYDLLNLGCPVDEISIKRRIVLLNNAGIVIDFPTFIDIMGLEDKPGKGENTFNKIQNRLQKMKSICVDIKQCKEKCKDLDDLEFE